MCVAAPMRLVELSGGEGLVELGGVTRRVSLALLDSVVPGDYLLIHAGFAIAKIDEEEARLTLEDLACIAECDAARGDLPPGDPEAGDTHDAGA